MRTIFNGLLKRFALFTCLAPVAGIMCSGYASGVPVISGYSPASRIPGATVSIAGTNFSAVAADNIVYFGSVRANVTTASETNLTVTVPVSATYAPITVTVGGLTAYSETVFQPSFYGAGTNIAVSNFSTRLDLATGDGPGRASIADMDGDGKPDLVIPDSYGGTVSIFRNISSAGALSEESFSSRVILPVLTGSFGNPYWLVTEDVDGDGKLDILALNADSKVVSIIRNISTPGNLTTNSFAPRVDISGGNEMRGIAVCDLNGDGRPEIVTSETSDNTISVFQNVGSVGNVAFAPRSTFASGASPVGLIIRDLDGDGNQDLVVGNSGGNTISVFQNLGVAGDVTTNSFAARVDFTTLPACNFIAAGDLDGDGKLDIVATGSGGISVLRNTSASGTIDSNSFAAKVDFAVGNMVNYVMVGDLDGDGKLDVEVTTQAADHLKVFKNLSSPGSFTSGSLASAVDFATGWNPFGISIGDLDGDLRPEIVFTVQYEKTVSIYQNLSPFGGPSIISGPVTNVTNGSVYYLLSSSTWTEAEAKAVSMGGHLVTINNEAENNWVYTTFNGYGGTESHLWIGLTDQAQEGTFVWSSGEAVDYTRWGAGEPNDTNNNEDYVHLVSPQDCCKPGMWNDTQDWAADAGGHPFRGVVEIVAQTLPAVPSIFAVVPSVGVVGTTVAIVGTNFSPATEENVVYFGAMRATVVAATETNMSVIVPAGATYAPITVSVGGLTAYANRAFLPTFSSSGSIITASSFADGFNLSSGEGPVSMVIADLDGDGKPDLSQANGLGHSVSVYRNISTSGSLFAGSFAARVDLALPIGSNGGDPYKLAAADLDGDGKLDLMVSEVSGSRVSVFRNISSPGSITTNSFAAPVSLTVGADSRSARVADLDGDGKVDIVAANYGANTISVLKNIGTPGGITTNSFAPKVDLSTPGGPYEVAIGDLDGDGKPDLAVVNNSEALVSLFRNTSTAGTLNATSFEPHVDLPIPTGGHALTIGDLDGDGKSDLVVGSVQGASISVYRNMAIVGTLTTSSFEQRVDFATGNWTHTIALGDLSGGGKPDISMVGEIPSHMAVFQNLSTPGSFTNTSLASRVDFAAGWNPWGVAVGDLDGDGRPDIVFCNAYDDTITIYRNQTGFGGAPNIVSHPINQTVVAGTDVTFSVVASGTTGLAYQWWHGENEIAGATSQTLTLTNVQSGNAGSYFVVVTNSFGSATSSNAVLTVLPGPAIVRVVNTTNMSGTPVTVPVALVANGDETALSFSLEFETQRLAYDSIDLGSGGAGAALLPNASQAANGRLGVTMAMPSGTFAPGVQEVVVVTFNTSPLLTDSPVVSPVIFANAPIPRQLADESAQPLPATFVNGTVTLLPSSLEADTAPRPNGNRSLDIFDWVQVGRFVAGLDIPATGSEFQRADCAPRSTLGDGQLKVTDWVQAGRYAALLDPIAIAGGPSSPVVPMALVGKMDLGSGREVRVAGGQAIESVATTLPVTIVALGDENALGFSLVFDAGKFTYSGLVKGTAATTATLNVNTNQADDGRVGVLLALTAGNSFPAGTRELVRISLKPKTGATGSNSVQFADAPVVRSISDSAANELTAGFATSALLVNPLPSLEISSSGDGVVITWPAWASEFELQTCGNDLLDEGGWTNYVGTIDGDDEKITVTIPITDEPAYFRLRHP